jgi:hypothetical protein
MYHWKPTVWVLSPITLHDKKTLLSIEKLLFPQPAKAVGPLLDSTGFLLREVRWLRVLVGREMFGRKEAGGRKIGL